VLDVHSLVLNVGWGFTPHQSMIVGINLLPEFCTKTTIPKMIL